MAIRLAIKGIESEPQGAIFYLHGNIPEDCFSYKESMLLAIFMGTALVNGRLSNLSIEELIKILVDG